MPNFFFLFTKYLYKYINANNVANVVANVAPAAITIVLFPDIFPIFSTIAIVNNVLNICSRLCELAVIDIFSLPLKYPLTQLLLILKILMVQEPLMLVLLLVFVNIY